MECSASRRGRGEEGSVVLLLRSTSSAALGLYHYAVIHFQPNHLKSNPNTICDPAVLLCSVPPPCPVSLSATAFTPQP